uniref:DB domain-containing protein n=1 Tax=Steinernema glaseri TaxID=37863 RepID=A0A1I7XVY4_9BILA
MNLHAAVLLCFVIASTGANPFAPMAFDCSRVDPSFCCVTRVKYVCDIKCDNIECVPPLGAGSVPEVKGPRAGTSISSSTSWNSHDGDSAPKRPKFEESIDSETSTTFATLIPDVVRPSPSPPVAPPRFVPPDVTEEIKNTAVQGETAPKPKKKKKSRIIKPPTMPGNEALVHIDEVDSDYREIPISDLSPSAEVTEAPVSVDSSAHVPPGGFRPKFSIKPSETKPDPSFPVSQFSIDGSAPDPKAVNGETRPPSTAENGIFTKKIDEVIGSLFKSAFNTTDLMKRRAKLAKTSQLLKQTQISGNDLNPSPSSSAVSPPQCGTAPEFTPCVEVQEANRRLLQCCRQKMLPLGCHDLCRYDVKQTEIKAAMDAGRCGLLSITPFLECASGGKNNVDCCRQRGIIARSGPQCEVFCASGSTIGPLGLQHVACGGVIGDLLHCHHAGLV